MVLSFILDNERGKKGKGYDIKGGGVRDRLLTTVCFNFHHTHHILEFVDQSLICQHFKAMHSIFKMVYVLLQMSKIITTQIQYFKVCILKKNYCVSMITNLFFKNFTGLQISQLINEFVKDVHNVLDIDNLDLWPRFQSLYITLYTCIKTVPPLRNPRG